MCCASRAFVAREMYCNVAFIEILLVADFGGPFPQPAMVNTPVHTHRSFGRGPLVVRQRPSLSAVPAGMSDEGDDDWDADEQEGFPPIIVFDLGAREWRCGWAGDDGPAVVVDPPSADTPLRAAFASAFEELEAEVDEHAILISERPGTQVGEREALASLLFELGARAVYASACPLLTLYHTEMDTGIVVDIGERSTYIYPIYEGHSVLGAATAVFIGGSDLPDGESGPLSACSDSLFEPSAAAKDGVARSAVGVHEALVRTVALVEMGLRGALLANVMLVGGGTRVSDFAERLTSELKEHYERLGPACSWRPKVVAKGDRRLACWMGGATLGMTSEASKHFVRRPAPDQGQTAPSGLFPSMAAQHAASSLPCLPLEKQEASVKAAAADEAAAYAASRARTRELTSRLASEARAWWMEQAPQRGELEWTRRHAVFSRVVQPLHQHALAAQVLGSHAILPRSQGGGRGAGGRAHHSDGIHSSDGGPSARLPLSAEAAVALAARALGMLFAGGSGRCMVDGQPSSAPSPPPPPLPPQQQPASASPQEERICRRVRQLLAASWACDVGTQKGDPAYTRGAQHYSDHEAAAALRRWRTTAEGWRARRQQRVAQEQLGASHWSSRALRSAAHGWMDVWVTEELLFQNHEKARSFRLGRVMRRIRAHARARIWVRHAHASATRHAVAACLRAGIGHWHRRVASCVERRARADSQWRCSRQRNGLGLWKAFAQEIGSATKLMGSITRFFLGWRFLSAMSRCTRRERRRQLLRAIAALHLARATAEAQAATLVQWRRRVREWSHKADAFRTADGHSSTRRRWKRRIQMRDSWVRWSVTAGGRSKLLTAAHKWAAQRLGAALAAWLLRLLPACVRGEPGVRLALRADEWGCERRKADVLARWFVRVRFGRAAQRKAAFMCRAASHSRARSLRVGWDGWRGGWSFVVLARHTSALQCKQADAYWSALRREILYNAITEWSTRSVYRLQKQKQREEAALLNERVQELRTVLAQGRKWAQKLVL